MKRRLFAYLSLLVMLTLACNLSTTPSTQAPGLTTQAPGPLPQENGEQPTQPPVGTPPSAPVSINDGLGSLNSYSLSFSFASTGPDPSQSSSLEVTTRHSDDLDATLTQISQSSVDKGGENPSSSDTEIYRIGNDQCTGSDTDWSWTSMDANQAEIMDLTKSMLGITPLIDTPTFVAVETVNDIPSNHFTFKVSGLGAKSGAIVNANQGDYWLAVDGQYIVKYTLILETSMDPQTNVLHEQISIDLTQVNQPISVAFPQTCLDASLVTPTP